MATVNVTDSSFQSDVLDADKPVLVDFWAEWCGPCKMIAPALEELSDELADRVTIAKMDIMENTDTPGKMGVQSIPYLVLFKNGQPAAQMRGAAPKGQLKQWLEGELLLSGRPRDGGDLRPPGPSRLWSPPSRGLRISRACNRSR